MFLLVAAHMLALDTRAHHHLSQPARLDAEFRCESGQVLPRSTLHRTPAKNGERGARVHSRGQRRWPETCRYVLANQTFNWPSDAMPRVAVPARFDSEGVGPVDALVFLSLCEQFIAHAFAITWARVCSRHSAGHRMVFVDSGANEGTWSVLAAAWGCHSLAVEPQSACIEWIKDAARHNRVADRVDARLAFLGPPQEARPFGHGACRRTFDGSSPQKHPRMNQSLVPTMPLSEMLRPSDIVALWHVDLEGAESGVLLSSGDLFSARRVQRVMVELSPQQWPRPREDVVRKLATLFEGWTCVVACSGRPFRWEEARDGRPRGTCSGRWRLQRKARSAGSKGGCLSQIFDVYCVAPTLAHDDPALQMLTSKD